MKGSVHKSLKYILVYGAMVLVSSLFGLKSSSAQTVLSTNLDSLRQQAQSDDFSAQISSSLTLIKHYTLADADSALFWYKKIRPVIQAFPGQVWDERFYRTVFQLGKFGDLSKDQRFELLTEVESYAKSIENFHLLLYVHRQLSHLFYHASQLDKSLEYQFLAMQDSRQPGVPVYTQVFPYISLAHIYGERQIGKQYADTALTMINKGRDYPPEARHWMHTHIGTYFKRIGNEDDALAHFETAHAIVRQNGELSIDPYLMQVLGKIYLDKGNFELAEEYFHKAQKISDEAPSPQVEIQIDIAEAFVKLALKTGDEEMAESNAGKIIEMAPGIGYPKPLLLAHRTLHQIYAQRGLFRKSNNHLISYFAIRDSLDVLDKANEEYLETRALELTINRNQMEMVEAKLQLQSSRMMVGAVLLLLASVLLVFFVMSIRTQKKHYVALSLMNSEIRASNAALVKMNEALSDAKKKAEESDQLKTSILQNMSHELRTPLTSILGYAEMMGDGQDDLDEISARIRKGGQRLMQTLTSVLDLAQLEGGSTTLKPAVFDFSQSLQKKMNHFAPVAQEKGLMLEWHVQEAGAFAVEADQEAVERIIANLLNNAIQFTDTGRVQVELARRGQDVVLSVQDSGIGMDEAFLPHAFDSFRQESTGHGRTHEGAGLGLPIAKHLVELMNGSIRVDSKKGEGSTFTLTLPIVVGQYQPGDG